MADPGKRVQLFYKGNKPQVRTYMLVLNKGSKEAALAKGYKLAFITRVPEDWSDDETQSRLAHLFNTGHVVEGATMISLVPTGTFRYTHKFPIFSLPPAGEQPSAVIEPAVEDTTIYEEEEEQ